MQEIVTGLLTLSFCSDKTALSFSKNTGLILHQRKKSRNSSIKFAIKDALSKFERENFVPDSVTIASVDYGLRNNSSFDEWRFL